MAADPAVTTTVTARGATVTVRVSSDTLTSVKQLVDLVTASGWEAAGLPARDDKPSVANVLSVAVEALQRTAETSRRLTEMFKA